MYWVVYICSCVLTDVFGIPLLNSLSCFLTHTVCRTYMLGAVCWQPTCFYLHVLWGLLGPVCQQLASLLGHVGPSLVHGGCMLATYMFPCNLQLVWGMLDPAWCILGAAGWQSTVLWHQARGILGLYVGNPQVLWGLLDRAWGILGCRLATCSFLTRVGPSLRDVRGVGWQPTGLMGPIGPSLEHLGAVSSVSWQPTGLLGPVGPLGCLLAT